MWYKFQIISMTIEFELNIELWNLNFLIIWLTELAQNPYFPDDLSLLLNLMLNVKLFFSKQRSTQNGDLQSFFKSFFIKKNKKYFYI